MRETHTFPSINACGIRNSGQNSARRSRRDFGSRVSSVVSTSDLQVFHGDAAFVWTPQKQELLPDLLPSFLLLKWTESDISKAVCLLCKALKNGRVCVYVCMGGAGIHPSAGNRA